MEALGIKRLYGYQEEVARFLAATGGTTSGAAHSGVLAGGASDLIVYAPTGYGKTLSYVLPIVNFLRETERGVTRPDGVCALVIVPTKELVTQVVDVLETFATADGFTCGYLSSLKTVEEECAALKREHSSGPDVVVALAARLALHCRPTAPTGVDTCVWNRLRYLVVDEADRLLSKSYDSWLTCVRQMTREADELRGVIPKPIEVNNNPLDSQWRRAAAPPRTSPSFALDLEMPFALQKIICTATAVKTFRGMNSLRLFRPLCVRAELKEDLLEQFIYECDQPEQALVKFLLEQIVPHADRKALVFCKTVSTARMIHLSVKTGCEETKVRKSTYLSGDHSAHYRSSTLDKFKAGDIRVLVSTDLTARGINIADITHVCHLQFPENVDEYIHRIGRTARAGRAGESHLFLSRTAAPKLERLVGEIQRARPTSRVERVVVDA